MAVKKGKGMGRVSFLWIFWVGCSFQNVFHSNALLFFFKKGKTKYVSTFALYFLFFFFFPKCVLCKYTVSLKENKDCAFVSSLTLVSMQLSSFRHSFCRTPFLRLEAFIVYIYFLLMLSLLWSRTLRNTVTLSF